MIDKLDNNSEFESHTELMKKLSIIKNKEVLRETIGEVKRKGNFVCIYPAEGSDYYDQFFFAARPLNRFIYKMLFTNELNSNVRLPQ